MHLRTLAGTLAAVTVGALSACARTQAPAPTVISKCPEVVVAAKEDAAPDPAIAKAAEDAAAAARAAAQRRSARKPRAVTPPPPPPVVAEVVAPPDPAVEAAKAADRALDKAGAKREARGRVIVISSATLFGPGKTALLRQATPSLTALAETLAALPLFKIVVEGHTDDGGPTYINMEQSRGRAAALREFLVSHGVASERVSSVGLAGSRPIADNDTDAGVALNRRMEIIVSPTGP